MEYLCNLIQGLLSKQRDAVLDTRRRESGVGAWRGEGKESNLASGEMDCEHTEDVILLRVLCLPFPLSPSFIKGLGNLKMETVYPT